jgi:hypothetical protein
MDRLPVVNDRAGIFADQVVSDLKSTRGAGFGIVFEHLTPADNSGVGGDFHKDPAISENKRFEFSDLDRFL